MTLRWYSFLFVLLATSLDALAQPQPQQVASEAAQRNDRAIMEALLARKISLQLDRVSLDSAIRSAAAAANIRVLFKAEYVERYSQLITMRFSNTSFQTVLDRIFANTNLRVVPITATTLGIQESPMLSSQRSATGTLNGRVIDSSSQKGVAGAQVVIVGIGKPTVTDANGTFQFSSIPIGRQSITVRLLGYQTRTIGIQIDTGITRTSIHLLQATTTLTEIITTATGNQRRVEVGNDITSINVDSVLKIIPIANFSDLLATRVPGVVVTKTSGTPGAPSKIRVRGLSSMNATNDPIIILDGIRMYATQGSSGATGQTSVNQNDRSTNLVGRTNRSATDPNGESPVLVSSPIDQIDPNSIETIEVLRGPSAVALYGTDAANGVIVVTTKRGQVGPAQVSGSMAFGMESLPGMWPDNYWMWGTRISSSGVIGNLKEQCPISNAKAGSCIPDTLVRYQVLNNEKTTIFGRGMTQTYRADVRGGKQGLKYAFSGSTNRTVGLLKMPDADVALLHANGKDVPRWQRRPQNAEQQSGQVRLDADINPRISASFTHMLARQVTRTTPLGSAVSVASELPPPGQDAQVVLVGGGSGLLTQIPDFRKRISSQTLKITNAFNFRAQPRAWANFDLTAGIDLSNRRDRSLIGRDECLGCRDLYSLVLNNFTTTQVALGEYSTAQGTAMVSSANLRSTAMQHASRWVSLRSSAGLNYQRTSTNDLSRLASDLPPGAISGNGAGVIGTNEYGDDRSTAGVYFETIIGLADRFYLPLAVRRDVGSGLGGGVAPTFPKLSFSYLLSDQSNFDRIPLLGRLSTVRLRTAYGRAGVQPSASAKLRLYTLASQSIDGATVPTVRILTAGNPEVRPERTSEIEGGVDLGVFHDRVNLRVTHYRKLTDDALVELKLPPSLGNLELSPTMQNVGQVQNTGLEIGLDARLLETEMALWSITANISRNRNRLNRLGTSSLIQSSYRFVEGYPLYGRWARPILAFGDLDGNGAIEANEIAVGDSSIYLGAPYPNYDASVNMTATFLSRFTVAAAINYQNGLNQINESSRSVAYRQENNDPNIPFSRQANFWAERLRYSNIGIIQTVSVLRFNSLSLNYIIPQILLRSIMTRRQVVISLQGSNLGIISNYRGKDPTVNGSMGDVVRDTGILPIPRTWQVALRIN